MQVSTVVVFLESCRISLPFTDMDFMGHRQRSYTAKMLDKMRKEKKNASRVRRVMWKHTLAPVNGQYTSLHLHLHVLMMTCYR